MQKRLFFLIALASYAFLSSCTEGLEFGKELVDEELFEVDVVDTFRLEARTVLNDSVRTFNDENLPTTLLIGHIVDPVFGISDARANIQLGIPSLDDDESPLRFNDAQLDSVVLTFVWDTSGFYGDLGDGLELEVYELMENLDFTTDYFANNPVPVGMQELGTTDRFVPDVNRSYVFNRPIQEEDSTRIRSDTIPGMSSIRLDDAFGERLLSYNSSVYENSETFREALNGIQIRASESSNASVAINAPLNLQLNLFYSYEDTASIDRSEIYVMTLSSFCSSANLPYDASCVRYLEFFHDRSGTPVQSAIDNPEDGKEAIYLQSMIGTSIEIDLPQEVSSGNILLNKAQLRLPVTDLGMSDQQLYPPIRRLVANYMQGDTLLPIIDVRRPATFNGFFTEDVSTGERYYELNITAFMQRVIDGNRPNTLVITPNIRARSPRRTVLNGTESMDQPIRLLLAYSEI